MQAVELVRDTASFLRFMRSIYARPDDVDRTHRQATVEFLKYVSDLGKATEERLQERIIQVLDPALPPIVAEGDRQALVTLRDFWTDMHSFVQPSRDADTLHTPVVLIEHLEEWLSKIPKVGRCKLVS